MSLANPLLSEARQATDGGAVWLLLLSEVDYLTRKEALAKLAASARKALTDLGICKLSVKGYTALG